MRSEGVRSEGVGRWSEGIRGCRCEECVRNEGVRVKRVRV